MLLILFVFSLLTGPAEYLTHEGAHYMVARAFGAHPIMHFDRIELPPSTHFTPAQNLLFAAAGPAADWAVGIVALVFLARRFTPLALVLAIWVARPLQFVHGLLGLDLTQLGISGDLVGTDEAVIAQALGVSASGAILTELIAAIPLLLLIFYYMPAVRRLRVAVVLTVGVLMGWVGWMAFASYLLP
jgi:hypothetical protein